LKEGNMVLKEPQAKLAHDLRSPISVIQGYVEYRKLMPHVTEEERLYLEALQKSTDKLARIADLLDDVESK
jgi:signal transduction histidine kinase